MLNPITTGLAAAVIVMTPRLIHRLTAEASFFSRFWPGFSWNDPVLLLGIASLAMVFQRFVLDRKAGARSYDGLADLFIHIHSPATPDSAIRWGIRGLISFLLTLCGGTVGPEGAAVELTHSMAIRRRSRSSQWFEQRRRTDASSALAAGISASFGAPFSGIMLSLELGIGGQTVSTVLSALSAYLGLHYISYLFSLNLINLSGSLMNFQYPGMVEWAEILIVGVVCGVIGTLIVLFLRYSQDSLLDLFQTQTWMRTLAGGILLSLVALIYKSGHAPSWKLLEDVLWSRKSLSEAGLLFSAQLLSIALIISAFGTVGIFWPLFAMGGFLGYATSQVLAPTFLGFSWLAGWAGGAGIFGAVIGAPLTGAILAFEMTQNFHVLLPCFLAAMIARAIREKLKMGHMISKDLTARGMSLIGGRAQTVLESLKIKDAMVTDYETVHEQEPVSELHTRLLKSRYPFLPVINSQGIYVGLLTVDMIQEAWRFQGTITSNSPLVKLLEAKDLLQRSNVKMPVMRVNDRLTKTAGIFVDHPCIPVVSDDGRVAGLLFFYNVRVAYDQEIVRHPLTVESREA